MKNFLFPPRPSASARRFARIILQFAIPALAASQALASTFTLESTTVILDEREGRVSFNVKNDGASPLLMVNKVDNLDGGNFAGRILISPPITRVDPGQSQQVNYLLKKGAPLDHEVLLKASFEGVTQQGSKNSMAMPIRQEIGFLVQPASVPKSDAPWLDLKVSVDGSELVLENPGKHVIRLSRTLTLMPGKKHVTLHNAWLMPGETSRVAIAEKPESVNIMPMSRYGFVLNGVTLPVTH